MRSPASFRVRATAATALAALLLLPAASASRAESQDAHVEGSATAHAAAIGFDAVVLRPIGFAVVLVGSVLFVPAALITAPNGKHSMDEAREIFVDGPAEYVFRRPLGDF